MSKKHIFHHDCADVTVWIPAKERFITFENHLFITDDPAIINALEGRKGFDYKEMDLKEDDEVVWKVQERIENKVTTRKSSSGKKGKKVKKTKK